MKWGDQALGFAHSIYLEDVCYKRPLSYRLAYMLGAMFGHQKVELHHRPALMNREKVYRYDHSKPGLGKVFCGYKPAANDRDFLVYVTKEDHGIETRVRGQGAQLSDLAIARKRKRKEKKLAGLTRKWPKYKPGEAVKAYRWVTRKRKWPKRKFPKRRKR